MDQDIIQQLNALDSRINILVLDPRFNGENANNLRNLHNTRATIDRKMADVNREIEAKKKSASSELRNLIDSLNKQIDSLLSKPIKTS